MIKRTLFFENQVYLSLKNEQLLISYPQKDLEPKTVPIEDIGIIVIETLFATLTTALSNKLMEHGIGLVICDARHMPSGLMLPLEGHTEQTKRIRTQIDASVALKKNFWQQTISAKITNQGKLLESRGFEAINLHRWAKEVQSGDQKNHESRAAIYYWSTIFPLDQFTRDPDGDAPNDLLNYGYSILRAITARAIVSSGLLPSIGIFHKNKYNAFCLADDIMEPYRPFVDSLVLELMDSGNSVDFLSKQSKIHLLGIMGMDVIMDKQKSPLMVAMSRTTSSLYDCFSGKSRKILYPLYV